MPNGISSSSEALAPRHECAGRSARLPSSCNGFLPGRCPLPPPPWCFRPRATLLHLCRTVPCSFKYHGGVHANSEFPLHSRPVSPPPRLGCFRTALFVACPSSCLFVCLYVMNNGQCVSGRPMPPPLPPPDDDPAYRAWRCRRVSPAHPRCGCTSILRPYIFQHIAFWKQKNVGAPILDGIVYSPILDGIMYYRTDSCTLASSRTWGLLFQRDLVFLDRLLRSWQRQSLHLLAVCVLSLPA